MMATTTTTNFKIDKVIRIDNSIAGIIGVVRFTWYPRPEEIIIVRPKVHTQEDTIISGAKAIITNGALKFNTGTNTPFLCVSQMRVPQEIRDVIAKSAYEQLTKRATQARSYSTEDEQY